MASLLQQIRDCNDAFRAGAPRKLDESGDPFVVLACVDGRLTGFLEQALGLPRRRALVIRSAGNQILESSTDVLRSIAAAAYLKHATELFIVGHTDCALTTFSAPDVIERFRRAGIPRSAFGDQDLRAWFGAFSDPGTNILASVARLRRSGILPAAFKIHGLMLGTEDAKLEVVLDGDTSREIPSIPVEQPREAETRTETPPPPPVPKAPTPQPQAAKPGKIPVTIADIPTAHAPRSAADAALVLRDFFVREGRDRHFQESLADLRRLARNERNPARLLPALERLVRDYRTRYPDLPGTFDYLKRALESEGTSGLQFMEFMRRILE